LLECAQEESEHDALQADQDMLKNSPLRACWSSAPMMLDGTGKKRTSDEAKPPAIPR